MTASPRSSGGRESGASPPAPPPSKTQAAAAAASGAAPSVAVSRGPLPDHRQGGAKRRRSQAALKPPAAWARCLVAVVNADAPTPADAAANMWTARPIKSTWRQGFRGATAALSGQVGSDVAADPAERSRSTRAPRPPCPERVLLWERRLPVQACIPQSQLPAVVGEEQKEKQDESGRGARSMSAYTHQPESGAA